MKKHLHHFVVAALLLVWSIESGAAQDFVVTGNAVERLRVRADNGFVGIGQPSPGFPLNFSTTYGDKISLWGNGGGHFGFGVQGAVLQIHTSVNTDAIAFGWGLSSSFTEVMRVKSTGNVGIGTSSPARRLDVRDGSGANGSGAAVQIGAPVFNGDSKVIYFGDGEFTYIGETSADDRMEIKAGQIYVNASRVGIGTETPGDHQLDVVGTFGPNPGDNKQGTIDVLNNGSYGSGVYSKSSNFGPGIYGEGVHGLGVIGEGFSGGVFGTSSGTFGVTGTGSFGNETFHGGGVLGYTTTAGDGIRGENTGTGHAVHCEGRFFQNGGSFEAHPTSTTWSTNKPATVKLTDGSKVKLFAEEAAEIYFNDYGEARLNNGRTHVGLDSKFLQTVTVDQEHPMKVFVQGADECNGMFVANRNSTGFDVVELHDGKSNASFMYRVVCKRKYYEDERLASEVQDIQYNKRMLETVWPEVIAQQKLSNERTMQREEQGRRERESMKARESQPLRPYAPKKILELKK